MAKGDRLVNLDAEMALLGAIMVNAAALDGIRFLKPEHFSEALHGEIFAAAVELAAEGRRPDPVMLKDRLPEEMLEKVDGHKYLAHLAASATTIINAPDYAKSIYELFVRREIRIIGEDIAAIAERPPKRLTSVKAQLDDAEERLAQLRESAQVGGAKSMAQHIVESVDAAAAAYKDGRPIGYQWFLPEIEEVVDTRIEPGDLIGLMGASGDAKTSTAVQQLRFSAEQGVPSYFLSGEQSVQQCIRQMHAQRLSIPARVIKNGHFDEAQFARVVEDAKAIEKLPLKIDTWSDMKIAQLGAMIRAFNRRYGPGLVIIDHAKKIVPDNKHDILAQQVFQTYEGLKDIAKDTGNAIILLMQRSSDFMKRRVMRPVRADAYGGEGTIQNLDSLLAIYQPGKWLRERAKIEEVQKRKDQMLAKAAELDDEAGLDATALFMYGLKSRFGDEGNERRVRFVGKFTRLERPLDEPLFDIPL